MSVLSKGKNMLTRIILRTVKKISTAVWYNNVTGFNPKSFKIKPCSFYAGSTVSNLIEVPTLSTNPIEMA